MQPQTGSYHRQVGQGFTNARHQVFQVIKFYIVVPNVCQYSEWNLLYVTLLAPRILKQLLKFWKICGILH